MNWVIEFNYLYISKIRSIDVFISDWTRGIPYARASWTKSPSDPSARLISLCLMHFDPSPRLIALCLMHFDLLTFGSDLNHSTYNSNIPFIWSERTEWLFHLTALEGAYGAHGVEDAQIHTSPEDRWHECTHTHTHTHTQSPLGLSPWLLRSEQRYVCRRASLSDSGMLWKQQPPCPW